MRTSVLMLAASLLVGCQREASTAPDPALVEPATFAAWPTVTDKPVQVGPQLWALCRALTSEEARAMEAAAKAHGPHSEYSIVVRVSPEAVAAFHEAKPLPAGAIVVKEKYADGLASGPLQGYAVMVKREAGYDPVAGDWEYAYVALAPERRVSRGRLAECAGCHASARDRDYLFRSYGGSAR
jgi:hypothetical protein